jgi:hypothetical protein
MMVRLPQGNGGTVPAFPQAKGVQADEPGGDMEVQA